jgi:hypothetical protein
MLSLTIFAATAGFAFGLAQFRVMMLIPAMAVLVAVAVGFGLTAGSGAWKMVGMVALIAIGLQLGYFAGLTKKLFRRAARPQSRPSIFGMSRFR